MGACATKPLVIEESVVPSPTETFVKPSDVVTAPVIVEVTRDFETTEAVAEETAEQIEEKKEEEIAVTPEPVAEETETPEKEEEKNVVKEEEKPSAEPEEVKSEEKAPES